MIVCIDEEDELPTSLTRLLWNPEGRYFIRENRKGTLIDAIVRMEDDYPALQIDPWWLKFTEMLVRFKAMNKRRKKNRILNSTRCLKLKKILFLLCTAHANF